MASDQTSGISIQPGIQENYGRITHLDMENQVAVLYLELNARTVGIKFDQFHHSNRTHSPDLSVGKFFKLFTLNNNICMVEPVELIPINAIFHAWSNQNKVVLKHHDDKHIEVPIECIKNNQYITTNSRFILWRAQDSFKFAEHILVSSPQPDLSNIGYQSSQATNPYQSAYQDKYSSYANPSPHSQAHQYAAVPPPQSGYHQPSYSPVPNYHPELGSPYYQSIEHREYLQFKLNEKILTCGKERIPLDVLRDSYSDSKIRQRFERLKEEFDSFRKSRGDGNCYYRAVGVSYLEYLCRNFIYPSDLFAFINNLYNNQGYFATKQLNLQTRDYFCNNLVSLYHHKSNFNDMHKLEELLQDPNFDMAMIAELRCITANYLEINKYEEEIAPFLFDGIENKVREILTYGNEAEGIEFSCIARGLGVFIKHISMVDDHSYDVYGPENVVSAPLLHVFYKGGHYDMIYTKNMTAIDGYDLFNYSYGKPQECSQEMVDSLYYIKSKPKQVEEAKEEKHGKSQEASLNTSLCYNPEPQHLALQYFPQVASSSYQSYHESSLTGSNIQYIQDRHVLPDQYSYHHHSASSSYQSYHESSLTGSNNQYIQDQHVLPAQYSYYQQSSPVIHQAPSIISTPYNQQTNYHPEILNSSMHADTSVLHQNVQDQKILDPHMHVSTPGLHKNTQDFMQSQKCSNPYEDTPGQYVNSSNLQRNPNARGATYHTPEEFPDVKGYSSWESASNRLPDTHYPIQSRSEETKNQASIPGLESLSLGASQKAVDDFELSCGCKISVQELKNQLSKLVNSLPDNVNIHQYLCRSCYNNTDIRAHPIISEQIQKLKDSKPSKDQTPASLKQKTPCIFCECEDIPLNRHKDFPSICLRCLSFLIRFTIIDFNHENHEYRSKVIRIMEENFSTCSVCKGIYKLKDVKDQEELYFIKMKPRCAACIHIRTCYYCGESFDQKGMDRYSRDLMCKQCVEESKSGLIPK